MLPCLTIQAFALGEWMTNCYVLHGERADPSASTPEPCWVVDAGFDPEPMLQYIRRHHLVPQQVLLTHAHLDHIGGLSILRAFWPDLPILIHPAEREFLTDPTLNLSAFLEEPLVMPEATGNLEHGQVIALAGHAFEVRHTPGHSPGGIALVAHELGIALAGDTLFAGSIGRTDFPTSDHDRLLHSIRTQLYPLPDTTRVLPGHGPETTIGVEKRTNPYVRVGS